MTRLRLLGAVPALATFALPLALSAQARRVDLTITEGTNLAAAVSPDGRTVALDLLGRIWIVPRQGGTAKPLTDELGDARQPVWSPDGSRIAFQSYRDGTWHIWSVAVDGTGLVRHTGGMFDHREPDYSPDGRFLVFSSDRAGNYDLWRLELPTGRLERLTDDPGDDFSPAINRDGAIAFVSNRKAGPGIWVRAPDGVTEPWVKVPGQLAGPAWSPDGRTIVFQQLDQNATSLLAAEKNCQPKRLSQPGADVFPFRASSSEGELFYTVDGGVRRIRPTGEELGPIPFSAPIAFVRQAYRRAARRFDAGPAEPVKGLVSPAVSPDGRSLAFVALGDLWLLTNGRLTQLTDDPFIQTDPVFSPDGKSLAYSSDKTGLRHIWVRDLSSGAERQVSQRGGGAAYPAWSPDGKRMVYQTQQGLGTNTLVVEVATGEVIASRNDLFGPSRATFSPDGKVLAVAALHPNSARFREGRNEILLIDLAGGPDRWFVPLGERGVTTRGTDGPVWSPDGTRMAFVVDGVLWTLAVAPNGEPEGLPVRLTDELAGSIGWTGDSRSIVFQTDQGLERISLADGAVTSIPVPLTWRRWNPTRRIVIHAGRVWTGRDEALLRDRDLVIEGHRIARIVPHAAALHRDSVVDGSALTLLPGLADAHSHQGFGTGEALGRTWLAYGITTIRDPASEPFDIVERREAVESGVRVGPRELATGRIFDGERIYYNFNNPLTAGAQLERELIRADRLRFDLIKTYVRFPDVLQRRVIEFAHGHGIAVSSHELYPAVAFGADHVEHIRGTSRRGYSTKMSALSRSYQDVIALLASSGMSLTPTMGIQGGFFSLIGRDSTVLDDPRLLNAYGPDYVRSLRAVRTGSPFLASPEMMAAQGETVRRVIAGGGRVVSGTDSPIIPYGLSLLTEIQHYVEGGLTPAQALRTSTSMFAEVMGLGAELGSIGPGKLADLVLVEGNPLERIADLRKTRIVIKNGEVFTVERLLKGAVTRVERTGKRATEQTSGH
jgi:Tol biopolymer transport system component/imidazolonepropionase-like amidohydrolase